MPSATPAAAIAKAIPCVAVPMLLAIPPTEKMMALLTAPARIASATHTFVAAMAAAIVAAPMPLVIPFGAMKKATPPVVERTALVTRAVVKSVYLNTRWHSSQ